MTHPCYAFSQNEYNVEALVSALRTAVSDILDHKLQDARHIVIKPNLSDLMAPETGVTTSPTLVEAAIRIIRERSKARISIVESDHWYATADEEFDLLGFEDIIQRYESVDLLNLSRQKKIRVHVKDKAFPSFDVARLWLDVDLFISIPKLKTHSAEMISCGLKNQFGLLPERYKAKYHTIMNQTLYWLNTTYPADLCLVDGVYALQGEGPADGVPVKCNLIIAASNCLRADIMACKTFGISPMDVPHLKYFIMRSGQDIQRSFGDSLPPLPKLLRTSSRMVFLSHRGKLFSSRHCLRLPEKWFGISASFFSFIGKEDIPTKEKISRLLRFARVSI
jgi:uncharacterized protein (DUF362 family)